MRTRVVVVVLSCVAPALTHAYIRMYVCFVYAYIRTRVGTYVCMRVCFWWLQHTRRKVEYMTHTHAYTRTRVVVVVL